MTVYPIAPRGFAANCYLLTADGVNAVAIDPAQPHVLRAAERLGLSVRYALLTHGHFDHVGGCAALQARGAKVGCLAGEQANVAAADLAAAFGVSVPPFTVDFTFSDGETLSLSGVTLRAIATPGHTSGSCCFLGDGVLFSGDTLFAGDVGRTDLPTGSARALAQSLSVLFALDDCTVYPGHGGPTSLAAEKARMGGKR